PDSQQFMFDAIELFVDTQEPGQRVPIEWILHDNQDLTALFQYDNQSSNRDSDYFLFVNDVETGTGVTEIGRGKTVANYVDGTRGDLDGDLNSEVQIVALLALADGVPAVNPVSRTDVNNDRNTTALDALRVINQLARSSGDPDAPIPANSQAFLDVNNDGQVTALDALQVINALARQNQADGEGLSDDEEDLIFSDQSFIDDLRWIGLNA
ncbi:MAG: dockerin type I domain-containing protein, partial [Planctomycetota bacterium]